MEKPVDVEFINHYTILCVSPTATTEEIKTAFRAKALSHHPDHAGSSSHEAMVRINSAYGTLKSPYTRKVFDRELRKATGRQGTPNPCFASGHDVNGEPFSGPFRFRWGRSCQETYDQPEVITAQEVRLQARCTQMAIDDVRRLVVEATQSASRWTVTIDSNTYLGQLDLMADQMLAILSRTGHEAEGSQSEDDLEAMLEQVRGCREAVRDLKAHHIKAFQKAMKRHLRCRSPGR